MDVIAVAGNGSVRVGRTEWRVLTYLGWEHGRIVPSRELQAGPLADIRPSRVSEALARLQERHMVTFVRADWGPSGWRTQGWVITPHGQEARRDRRPRWQGQAGI